MKTKERDACGPFFRVISERPERLFAIGDIHGHADELSYLLDYLVTDQGCSERDQVIFIGDYIDRGKSSNRVIERLIEFRQDYPKSVFLKGNHEEMLFSFLGLGGDNGEYYLKNGGASFFESYSIVPRGSLTGLRAQIPVAHLDFLKELELGVALAEFLFVHAGVSPNRRLDQQRLEDILWIREEFLAGPHPFGKTVVFGHTAFNRVYVDLPYRIGIDTGVAYGNKLSMVELVCGEVFQIAVGEKSVKQSRL